MELKDRIKEAMTAAKLSPADLARATKSTNAAINFWLTGKTKSLKAEKAAMIETATGYCAQWVIRGKGKKLLIDEKNTSNKPLDLTDKAQAATNNVATLEQSLEGLAHYMASLDESDRRAAMRMIDGLADDPTRHAKTAAGIKAMVGAAFAPSARKVA